MPQSRQSQFFREIKLLNDLQMRPEERAWLDRPPKAPQPTEVVLYLGCNVLRTPHMVRTVVDILRLLSVDFVAVGGAAYCCGVPYRQDPDTARQVGERTAAYFLQFRPQRVVFWCPGCLAYYQDTLDPNPPYQIQHATEFLAEHVDRLPLARPAPRRVALHYHTGRPQTEREAAAAQRLLRAVPELELVEVGSDPRLGRSCTGAVLRELGREGWEAAIAPQMELAAALGVEVLATLYHSCHRFLVACQEGYPLAVEHYLSLVGQALGLDHEDRYKKYMLWGNAERILEDAAPCLEANSVRPEAIHPVVQRIFGERQLG